MHHKMRCALTLHERLWKHNGIDFEELYGIRYASGRGGKGMFQMDFFGQKKTPEHDNDAKIKHFNLESLSKLFKRLLSQF